MACIRLFILSFLIVFFKLNSTAQVNTAFMDNVFYQEVIFETDDYKLFLVKCSSNKLKLKMKIRIFNKTGDIILIKPEEIAFMVKDKKLTGWEKPMIVQPNGDEVRTIDIVDPGMDMRLESFNVVLDGFYKIAYTGETTIQPELALPSKEASEFTAGDFHCVLLSHTVENEKTFAKYQCTYKGDKIGVLDPSKAVLVLPSNAEVASALNMRKSEALIFEKSSVQNFLIEFRNINRNEPLNKGVKIKWNDTFRSSSAVKLKPITVPMKIDLEKSEK